MGSGGSEQSANVSGRMSAGLNFGRESNNFRFGVRQAHHKKTPQCKNMINFRWRGDNHQLVNYGGRTFFPPEDYPVPRQIVDETESVIRELMKNAPAELLNEELRKRKAHPAFDLKTATKNPIDFVRWFEEKFFDEEKYPDFLFRPRIFLHRDDSFRSFSLPSRVYWGVPGCSRIKNRGRASAHTYHRTRNYRCYPAQHGGSAL